jgi:hypothetical protein
MKANNYISKNEYRLLLIIVFVSFILSLSNLAYQIVEINNKSNPYGLSEAPARPLLLFNFLTLFIFIVLFFSKRFLISSILTLCSFIIFAYEFYSAVKIILLYKPFPELSLIEQFLIIGNYFDYIVFFLVSILLFWQISILLRMLVKTLQKDEALP